MTECREEQKKKYLQSKPIIIEESPKHTELNETINSINNEISLYKALINSYKRRMISIKDDSSKLDEILIYQKELNLCNDRISELKDELEKILAALCE